MPYTLQGRNVLVTGGSRGLGAVICEKFAIEGAHIMVNYVSNKERAIEVAKRAETYGVKAFVIQGVWIFCSVFYEMADKFCLFRMQVFQKITFESCRRQLKSLEG